MTDEQTAGLSPALRQTIESSLDSAASAIENALPWDRITILRQILERIAFLAIEAERAKAKQRVLSVVTGPSYEGVPGEEDMRHAYRVGFSDALRAALDVLAPPQESTP